MPQVPEPGDFRSRLNRYADNFVNSSWAAVITHTIIVAGVTASAFLFVFDSNKVSAAQTERDMYKAKVDTLEKEIDSLNDKNQQYLTWLQSEPGSTPALEREILRLQSENKLLSLRNPQVAPNLSTPTGRGATLSMGETFVDSITGASIGLMGLTPPAEAKVYVVLPGEKQESVEVGPGKSWDFVFHDVSYRIQIISVDWYSNKITVSISEH